MYAIVVFFFLLSHKLDFGENAKAKANAATGIPEMIEISVGKHFRENREKSIREMQKMDGIDMTRDSRFRFMMIKVN